jgi:hypothetical protein
MEQKPEGGTTIFVLGLLGLLLCGLLGIPAWIMGNSYMEKCRAMGVQPDGLAVAGRIMGMIVTGLMILGLVVGGLIMCAGIIGGAAGQ